MRYNIAKDEKALRKLIKKNPMTIQDISPRDIRCIAARVLELESQASYLEGLIRSQSKLLNDLQEQTHDHTMEAYSRD